MKLENLLRQLGVKTARRRLIQDQKDARLCSLVSTLGIWLSLRNLAIGLITFSVHIISGFAKG